MTDDSSSTGTHTMLLIEDDPGVVSLMPLMLSHFMEGIEVLTAMDGMAGLELAASHRPELILLDNILPDIDSLDVLRRLKADPALSGVPVVMFSGDMSPRFKRRCRELGADDFLLKPCGHQELIDKINKFIGQADQKDGAS
jgi:DNA-binding response OmpR family regulator